MQGPFQLLIITGPIIWCHKTFPIASMENKDQQNPEFCLKDRS